MGFVGMARDEETLRPTTYLASLPGDLAGVRCSCSTRCSPPAGRWPRTIDLLVEHGADDVTAVCLVAAPEGVARLAEAHPTVRGSSRPPSTSGSTSTATSSRGSGTRGTGSSGPCPEPTRGSRGGVRDNGGHERSRADRRGVALRQRPAAHRPRVRLRCALRRLLALPADGRQPGAHGVGHRRARHADPGAGRRRGLDAPRARRQVLAGDPGRPRRARPVVRPVHAHEHRQPPPRHAGPLHRAVEQRLRPHREDPRRDQPVDRPHAARPLHRGHLPDLRLPERARRPVRQLRQPARPGRPDQPAQPDQRRDPAVRRDRAPAVRPAGVLEVARVVARHPDALAAQRPELQQAPGRRPQAARDQPRPRLGRAHPAGRLARPADEAVLRLVRRGDRLPVGVGGVGAAHRRPGRVEAVVVRPGRAVATTSWARTTSPSTR